MDFNKESQVSCSWYAQIENCLLQLLWHLIHVTIDLWYFPLGIADVLESYLISWGLLGRYKSFNVTKLRYLAIVVDSEEVFQTSKIIRLLQWLEAVGIKHVCLYDNEGVLKKSKDFILEKLDGTILFWDAHENDVLSDRQHMTLEFVSFSDGKEAVVKAANVLFMKYSKSGSGGPKPDLLLVYGPARCHLGFPAWRIPYTEIVHMGPLKSMNYGSLVKAIYKFTMVQPNYGK
ncbi:hypothetical protein GQ457_17G011840 [Hibiscus cannabinus]